MKKNEKIITSGLFISLGIVFPIIFHQFGLGPAFLPMFLPPFIASFIFRPVNAMVIGIATPFLSSLLTGMPPMVPPITFVIAVELVFLTLTVSFCFKILKLNLILSLILGIIAERIGLILSIYIIAPLFNFPSGILTISSFTASLPGIVLQIVVVPIVIHKLKNTKYLDRKDLEKP